MQQSLRLPKKHVLTDWVTSVNPQLVSVKANSQGIEAMDSIANNISTDLFQSLAEGMQMRIVQADGRDRQGRTVNEGRP